MPLLGREGADKVSFILTPTQLVRLARDLLISRGHKLVRQTDGPGDGGRDVHSLTKGGQKHITQCKHHQAATYACSSEEVSELPMAMTKFGVTHGLFLTDARISPQAKREYLNDYPKLNLEFLDRDELFSEILAYAPLRALWFDGARIGKINSSIVFPMIIRRHERDEPLLPLRYEHIQEAITSAARNEATARQLSVKIRQGRSHRTPFDPYRLPRRLTMDEGGSSDLCVTEIAFHGTLALHELAPLAETLSDRISSVASAFFDRLTVIIGRPFVTPLEGDQAGLQIVANTKRATRVTIGKSSMSEEDWFLPEASCGWALPRGARTSQSEWIRLHHGQINAALAYEIITPMTPAEALIQQAMSESWRRSVFALLPTLLPWNHENIEEPDEKISWTYEPGISLCAWFHPTIKGGTLIRLPSDLGDDTTLEAMAPDPNSPTSHLETVREKLARIRPNALIAPERARHMAALLTGVDPLAEQQLITFRTIDIISAFHMLASPIDPLARRAEITVVWDTSAAAEDVISEASRQLAETKGILSSTVRDENFVILTLTFSQLPSNMTSTDWIKDMTPDLDAHIAATEAALTSANFSFRRATADYWLESYDIIYK